MTIGTHCIQRKLDILKPANTPEAYQKLIKDGLAIPPWSSTARPSPTSSLLSRFTKKFDAAAITTATQSLPPETRSSVLPVLYASASIQSHYLRDPWGIALGGDTLVVAGAGGFKGNDACAFRYTIPAARWSQPNPSIQQTHLLDGPLETGFAGPFGDVLVDSYAIWGAGDERIKAFDLKTGKLKHTLSCAAGEVGMFGVHMNKVFRANTSGRFSCWDRATMQTHEPTMGVPEVWLDLFMPLSFS